MNFSKQWTNEGANELNYISYITTAVTSDQTSCFHTIESAAIDCVIESESPVYWRLVCIGGVNNTYDHNFFFVFSVVRPFRSFFIYSFLPFRCLHIFFRLYVILPFFYCCDLWNKQFTIASFFKPLYEWQSSFIIFVSGFAFTNTQSERLEIHTSCLCSISGYTSIVFFLVCT